jgi:hypothetical protein
MMEEVSDDIAELEDGEYLHLVDDVGAPHDQIVFGGHVELTEDGETKRAACERCIPPEKFEQNLRDYPDRIRHAYARAVDPEWADLKWIFQECSDEKGHPVTIVE